MNQKLLFILNDPPYDTERSYNALRLARTTIKTGQADLKIFLFGGASGCAIPGQQTPDGYYNIERMVRDVARRGGDVGVCGACLDARGFAELALVEGAHRSSMDELGEWTLWADKAIVF
ncbi:MAG: DsrE family protein [Actinobacteria bacterium]|nr:DsrE family protein [Actinomycetota bacterium]